MAVIYYKQMVSHGKNHKQALGAVMTHLGARVLKVLLEDRPYELRDIDGKSVTRDYAKELILTKYHVSEEIRRLTGEMRQPKLLNLYNSTVSQISLTEESQKVKKPLTTIREI
jgi:hypothetical protein